MRIGIGMKDGEGRFRFDVELAGLAPFALEMERVEQPTERGPRYLLIHRGDRCGAMWKRTPKGGGEAFLSGNLESPLFPGGKIELAAFVAKEGAHQMDLVWSPPRALPQGQEQGRAGEEEAPF